MRYTAKVVKCGCAIAGFNCRRKKLKKEKIKQKKKKTKKSA